MTQAETSMARTAVNPDALRGSFGWYRELDATVAAERAAQGPAADDARPGDRRRVQHAVQRSR